MPYPTLLCPCLRLEFARSMVLLTLSSVIFLHCSAVTLGQEDEKRESTSTDRAEESHLLQKLIRGRVVDEVGRPVADALITTLTSTNSKEYQTHSLTNGTFLLRLPADGYYGKPLLVTAPNNELASYISGLEYTADDRVLFEVILKPWRITAVKVTDARMQAVSDATLIMQADYQEIARAKTDAKGEAVLKYPADAKVDWVNAFRDGQGYDYYENYDSFPSQERLQVPEALTLQLRGAISVEVQVSDSAGRPVAGVGVMPWTLHIEDKLSYANVGGILTQKTDQDGRAHFDYIPSNLVRDLTFLIHSEDYFCARWPSFSANSPSNMPLKAEVLKLATIRGTVRYPDGSPAAGITIQGEGRGATNNYYRGYTSSKADGSYELKIYPDQDTIIATTTPSYAANATVIGLAEGQEENDVDLQLSAGTRIHGKLTVGETNEPAAGQTATLIQQDGSAQLVRWNETDDSGRYEFRVAEGTYNLRVGSESIQVQVTDEAEIVHDASIARLPRGILSGMVTDQNGKGIPDAVIVGESLNEPSHAGFKTIAKVDGQFSTERWHDSMRLFAYSAQSNLAGQTTIGADAKTTTLQLLPGARLTGRVLDSNGHPVAQAVVQLQSHRSQHLSRELKTDRDGKYSFSGLLLHSSWTITATQDGSSSNSQTIQTRDAKQYQLESLLIEPSLDIQD